MAHLQNVDLFLCRTNNYSLHSIKPLKKYSTEALIDCVLQTSTFVEKSSLKSGRLSFKLLIAITLHIIHFKKRGAKY